MMRCWAMEESFLRLMTGVVQEIRQGKQQVYIVPFFFLFSCRLAGAERGLKVDNSFYFVPFFVFGSRVLVSSGETAETTQSLVYSWGAGRRRLVTPPLGR
jgi:hypothetical protein